MLGSPPWTYWNLHTMLCYDIFAYCNKLERDIQISKHHLISQIKLDNGLYDRFV